MKITYRFIDGTETIVEVANESLAKIILDMNRQEDARQHRIAYNERSIELFNELGIQLGTHMTLKVMFKKKLKKESELRKPYPI